MINQEQFTVLLISKNFIPIALENQFELYETYHVCKSIIDPNNELLFELEEFPPTFENGIQKVKAFHAENFMLITENEIKELEKAIAFLNTGKQL